MKFLVTVSTDVGILKETNQDSCLVKHISTKIGEILLAVVCDGMGGLSKGELASATVVRAFSHWFNEELPYEIENLELNIIGEKWSLLLKDLNSQIIDYSGKHNIQSMGTTFTAVLFINGQYLIGHVGDSRIYKIESNVSQLTTDHTFVAREIAKGKMTLEQAKTDKRRNLLLQCIGASKNVTPQIIIGEASKGTYLICSDGFRHEITENEMLHFLSPNKLSNKKSMQKNVDYLINQIKNRGERDNISAILIKAY